MKHTPRIYLSRSLKTDQKLVLDKQTTHHLITVLRLKPNRDVIVFDGTGNEYRGQLIQADKKQCVIELKEKLIALCESPLQVELLQGLARHDRMDTIIQKAVELGVHSITPIWTEFSNVKIDNSKLQKNGDHWQKIIVNATEQSGRHYLMHLNPPCTLSDWLKQKKSHDLKLFCHPNSVSMAATTIKNIKSVCLVIGPEGGLSDNEVVLLKQHNFNPLTLGPRILRTETAALAAVALLQQQYGDMLETYYKASNSEMDSDPTANDGLEDDTW